VLRLHVTANVAPSSPTLITLITEATHSFKTSVPTGVTRRHIPDDDILLRIVLQPVTSDVTSEVARAPEEHVIATEVMYIYIYIYICKKRRSVRRT
jgi:hypothetical protein